MIPPAPDWPGLAWSSSWPPIWSTAWPNPWLSAFEQRPPWARAVADPFDQPRMRAFEIRSVEIAGARRAVAETLVFDTPFAALSALRADGADGAPKALLVTPMSGHYAIILRDLAKALLRSCQVFALDWPNPCFAPRAAGDFGFADNVEAVVRALRAIGPGAHLVGVCQGAVPAAAAAALMHQRGEPTRPTSLALLGGPIDPAAAPTPLSRLLSGARAHDLRSYALEEVPAELPGAGRLVYPAVAQWRGLLLHLARHWTTGGPLSRKLMNDDGDDPERFPFLTVYTSVKDIPGPAFVQSIQAIFQARLFARGALEIGGERVRPEAARALAVMTVAAADDDVVAPAQTEAAHALFANAPEQRRQRLLAPSGGHFALFHGAAARGRVAPALASFFHASAQGA